MESEDGDRWARKGGLKDEKTRCESCPCIIKMGCIAGC